MSACVLRRGGMGWGVRAERAALLRPGCDRGGRDGAARPPGGAVLGRLLSRLLIDAGRRVDVDALVEAVWGDRATTRSVSTLESHLHRLRRFLEPDRARGAASALLTAESGGYRLVVPGDRIDSAGFARLVRESAETLAAGDAGRAVERAEQARALWRGRPYVPWSDEPWATATGRAARGAAPPADGHPRRRPARGRPPGTRARRAGAGARRGPAAQAAVGAVPGRRGAHRAHRGRARRVPARRPPVPRRAGGGAGRRAAQAACAEHEPPPIVPRCSGSLVTPSPG